MTSLFRSSLPSIALLLLLGLCIAVYWTGLSGGFVFDDGPNLYYIQQWFEGKLGLREAVLYNLSSSPLDKRALSMGSFALSAWLAGGVEPFAFKLHNLLLHCLTGVVLYGLAKSLMNRTSTDNDRSGLAALAVAGLWVLHPLHVSTVLYSVQRMAQISAIMCMLGMWLYMTGRRHLQAADAKRGAIYLLAGIPILTLLAIQGKQNGAVLPLLCLVLELAYFQHQPRPRLVGVFIALFCVLPMLAVIALLMMHPSLLMGGYAEYDFSWLERLLSQSRALIGYAGQFLIPHTPSMGLATDDFIPSRGLLHPPSTLGSLLLLALASGIAISIRKHRPTLFAGWFVFLVGHGVESSFLPLELYYEHRNLLPSVGLTLIVVDSAIAAGRWLSQKGVRTGRVGVVAAAAVVLVLSVMTHGRARVWSDPLVLFQTELDAHPNSYRAIVNYVGTASDLGDVNRAYAVVRERRANADSPYLRGRMYLVHAWLDCLHRKEQARPEDVLTGIRLLPPRVEVGTFLLFDLLAKTLQTEGCGALDELALARAYQTMADHASEQPDSFLYKAAFRTNAAVRYAAAGKWQLAERQARLGWQPSTPPRGAAALVEIMLISGDIALAERILREARQRRDTDGGARQELDRVELLLRQEKAIPGWNRKRVSGALGPNPTLETTAR